MAKKLNIKAGDIAETDQENEKLVEQMAKAEDKKQATVTPLKIVRKSESGEVVKTKADTVDAEEKPAKVVKVKAEKPAKVEKPKAEKPVKPAKVIAKSLRIQAKDAQTAIIVTAYTTQELLDKCDQFKTLYGRNPDVMLEGRVLVAGEPRLLSGFCPATHVSGDTWHLFYDAVDVEPLSKTWDSAKIGLYNDGVVAARHGKLSSKAEVK
jgi:hypothetical protein